MGNHLGKIKSNIEILIGTIFKLLTLISIIMGVTFAIYGMIKKKMDLNPLKTVFIEIGLLSPLALAFLLFIFKKRV